jgi:hypothetical protein
MTPNVTRRQLLGSIGATGAIAAVGLSAASGGSREYTKYTYAEESGDDSRLRVAWWATHNGQVVSTQGDDPNGSTTPYSDQSPTYVTDTAGPQLEIDNVLPGDEGRVAVGVEAEVPEGEEREVWYRAELFEWSENGVNEPEREAGDEPIDEDNEGEFSEYAGVTVWEDQGIVGGCDGELDMWESEVADGSLESVLADLEDGQSLGCLEDGEGACLGLWWELPATEPDINVVQGDSATFQLTFGWTTQCGDPNPLDGGEE